MAVLLLVGVVLVLVLLYGADRFRQARSRARLLHAMNDRLTVAAAQIDQEQERRHRVARASAELTSVLPAIRRPPLTLPGVPGQEPDPAGEAATGQRAAGKAGPAEPAVKAGPAEPAGKAGPAEPAGKAPEPGGSAPDEPAAEAERPAAGPAGGEPAAPAREVQPGRPAEITLTLPGLEPAAVPAAPQRVTGEDTLIMSPVPAPGSRDGAAAGDTAKPEARPARGRTGPHPRPGYQQANSIQPGGS